MTNFYPEVKPHMSPSAIQQWFNQRSAFVRSYFEGEKTPETASMRTGTKVHRMIEMGLIPAKCVYSHSEETLTVDLGDGIKFLGVPDSYVGAGDKAMFADYKTGKANDWKEKLPTDIKMKATAWLVWNVTNRPKFVDGKIEYIATEWDQKEKAIVPIEGRETEVIEITYSHKELEAFTQVILKAIAEINEFYEKWLKKDASAINQKDIDAYIELKQAKDTAELAMKEIGQRILEQMEFGGIASHKVTGGSFYTITKKSWDYPENLPVDWKGGITLEDAEAVAAATKTALKNYELATDPKTETTSIGFRTAKEK
jgi:hypothetical protein